ncbi:MAG: hypothetical protein M3Y64_00050 [Gemmatimonadota bacterium]|nr:hypothetical protein [Gemmatimonadota bacterium]
MKRLKQSFIAALLVAAAACSKDSCVATDGSCAGAAPVGSKTFAVMMTSAPPNLGAIIFDVDGGGKKTLTLTTDATIRSQAAASTGSTAWRAVLLGKPTAVRIGTIVLDSASTVLPTATVVDAAANASGNFLPIPAGSITLIVQKLN